MIESPIDFDGDHEDRCYLKEESYALTIDIHLKSLEGENVTENYVPVSLLVDLSSTQSLENIVLNEFFPEHIDTEFT